VDEDEPGAAPAHSASAEPPEDTVVVYVDLDCGKCRGLLRILRDRRIPVIVDQILETPPDATTLAAIVMKLHVRPRDLVRTKEPAFAALGLDLDDDAAVLNALEEHPELIERPIVVRGPRAVIARPPERVLEIL
jgi:arsenate reductase